jgi:hypothetical protein
MDIRFTIWSLQHVLNEIPLDTPVEDKQVYLNFSKMDVPYYVKQNFRVSLIYEEDLPYDACCCTILSTKKTVLTVVIIIKKQYEENFKAWKNGNTDNQIVKSCCTRRELYSHETCHLIAIIRAFPSDRISTAMDDFLNKIKNKFKKSVQNTEKGMDVPMASIEKAGISPSIFDKDHFRYESDNLNYFQLYQELVLPCEKMDEDIPKIFENYKKNRKLPTFDDVAEISLVSQDFFGIFPEKLIVLREMISKKIFG